MELQAKSTEKCKRLKKRWSNQLWSICLGLERSIYGLMDDDDDANVCLAEDDDDETDG